MVLFLIFFFFEAIYILYTYIYYSFEKVLKKDHMWFLTCYFLLENSSIEVGLFFV